MVAKCVKVERTPENQGLPNMRKFNKFNKIKLTQLS